MPQPQCLLLQSSIEQGVLVLTILDSKLQDEKAVDDLLAELVAIVDYFSARNVAIDLHNIKYVSSVAFRPFLKLRRKLRETGGRLVLCNLEKVVGDVFYTTKLVSSSGSLDAPFEMQADVPAAIALLNSEREQIQRGTGSSAFSGQESAQGESRESTSGP